MDRTGDAQFFVAVFKPSLIERVCRSGRYEVLKQNAAERGGVLNPLLDLESYELIRSIMNSLLKGSPDADLMNREAGYGPNSNFRFEHREPDVLNAGLRFLLVLCWRCQLTGKGKRDAVLLHPVVRKALKLLSESRGECSLDDLANACGASRSHLSRTFRRQVGVPMTRYRNSQRLCRFFEEYAEPERKTLAEAVYAAGFGSYAQFYKVFTQFYGRGPREAMALRAESVPQPSSAEPPGPSSL